MAKTSLVTTRSPDAVQAPPPPTINHRGDNLDVALGEANENTARNLLALGANPNGVVDESNGETALGDAISRGSFWSARLMLQALAERDQPPILMYPVAAASAGEQQKSRAPARNYFDWVLHTAGRGSNTGHTIRTMDLARHLNEVFEPITVPPSWQKALGEAFLNAGGDFDFWRGEGRLEIFEDLLGRATFDGPEQLAKAISVIAEDMLKQDHVDAIVTLAKRLVEAGGHPDQISITYSTGVWGPRQCTWLHGAARRDLGELVRQLLDLGADPAVRSDNGAGPDAYELVIGKNVAKGVLDAWKAKTAIESVIRSAGHGIAPTGVTP